MGFVFISGFLLGILAIVAAEAAGFIYLLRILNRKRARSESKSNPGSNQSIRDIDSRQSIDFYTNKEGVIWILAFDESLKNWMNGKSPKEQRRKDVTEVQPVRRIARIKDHNLILSESDGSLTSVPLKGCSVEAVSASELGTRKWAKRYPIKVESNTSDLYKGSRAFYIYLETCWKKEAWCKALRLAACEDQEQLIWFEKLKTDFSNYLMSLNDAYPSFMKPSLGFNYESWDKGNKNDGLSSSKVQLLWKKLQRKCSIAMNPGNREDTQTSSVSSSEKSVSVKKTTENISEENDVPISSCSDSHGSHVSGASESDSKDKIDEGTMAWNLLISRLFFDSKRHSRLNDSIQARIQRTLSNMRIPSYIGEVICSGVDTGTVPPYIHGIRVLPMEKDEVWAFELDVEYSGGAVLDVDTRIEVRDVELQKGINDSSSVEDVPPVLLEGLEDYQKQLHNPIESIDAQVQDTKSDGSIGSKCTKVALNNVSKWKSIIKNIAEQVSQVAISLSIRVSSLRGTLRVHIKPPPSDQLWFGFTSMPDIEFDLMSSVGEHKITNSHVPMFLINRFKNAIRETMVLPNREYITIPWMIAEKSDWVQRKMAPFMWLNQETANDHNSFEPEEAKPAPEDAPTLPAEETVENHETKPKPNDEDAADVLTKLPIDLMGMAKSVRMLEEMKVPLLERSEKQRDVSSYVLPLKLRSGGRSSEEEEAKMKKMGRRARMFDIGKKMGEKIEEKRRHIEEKSRNIVEKMRGPQ